MDGSGSQTCSPRGSTSRQCGGRAADLFSEHDVATSGLHETASRARKSYQTEGSTSRFGPESVQWDGNAIWSYNVDVTGDALP